ncbi:MAG: GNAT family N-acetyltransferase [Thermoprotei archaeon]|jgi:N-acetylglutamate synthase-like GNAT family acetyltransferase
MNKYEIILKDGSKVFIRAVSTSDIKKIIEFLNQLDPESVYMRFGHFVRFFDEFAQKIVCDKNSVCLLAHDEHGNIVGIADAHISNEEAEVGVVVHQNWRNKGLGKKLINLLIDETQKRGVKWLYAYVLRENIPVLNLLRKFNAKPVASYGDMVKVKGPALTEKENT